MRSRAAAELLSGQGFKEVYSLRGGIQAWQGARALGPPEQGLGLVRGDETAAQLLALAYGLEQGLFSFYQAAAGLAGQGPLAQLLTRLAGLEGRHKDQVWGLYQQAAPGAERAQLEAAAPVGLMEGGRPMEEALASLAPQDQEPAGLLELAMGVETQALDLYLRLARASALEAGRQALLELGQQEKAHLQALGKLMGDVLQ